MCISYLREVVDDICYQGSIKNNLFVITNMGKVGASNFPPKQCLGGS